MAPFSTAELANWVAKYPRIRTIEAKTLAINGLRDVIGCMLAGANERVVLSAIEVSEMLGRGNTSAVGQTATFQLDWAACLNAVAGHAHDFDDSFDPLTGHPSVTIASALIPLSVTLDETGEDMIDAYVVGLQVAACLGKISNPSHVMRGWHATMTIGTIATAAACARLLRLDPKAVATAISYAVSKSSGTCMQIGWDAKAMQAGFAAQHGLQSAVMANAGLEANTEPLLGDRGFFSLYTSHDGSTKEVNLPQHDSSLAINEPGLTFKPYPTSGSSHRSIAAMLELRRRHNIRADEVADVQITVPQLNVNNLKYTRPKTGTEGKFSMHYTCAVALVYGSVSLADFEKGAVFRPEVQAIMERIRMGASPGSDKEEYLAQPARARITLKDGKKYEDIRFHRDGSRSAPMTAQAAENKFFACAERQFTREHCVKILGLINGLGSGSKVKRLSAALAGADD